MGGWPRLAVRWNSTASTTMSSPRSIPWPPIRCPYRPGCEPTTCLSGVRFSRTGATRCVGQFHFGLGPGGAGTLNVFITQGDGNAFNAGTDPDQLPLEEWQHVAFIADAANQTVTLYRNGENVDEQPYDGTFTQDAQQQRSGHRCEDQQSPARSPTRVTQGIGMAGWTTWGFGLELFRPPKSRTSIRRA